MKVLYLLHNIGWEGSLISFVTLLKGISINNDITVILVINSSLFNNEKFLEVIKPYNVSLYVIDLETSVLPRPCGIRLLVRKSFNLVKSLFRLIKLIRKVQPDIIHTNTGVIHTGFLVSKLYKIPHVWHLREYQDFDFNLRILPSKSTFRYMLNHSNVISITDDIIKHFDIHSCGIVTTIYNGIYSKSDISSIKNKEKYFLMASRISPEKCHEDVINAFSVFLKTYSDYQLIIAGNGDSVYIEGLKSLVNTLGIDKNVKFVGFCTPSEIKEKMQKSKSLIVSSKSEGFGRMTAECACNGSYVIGRNSGGTKEIIKKIGGCLYDGTVNALVREMIKVVELSDEDYFECVKNMQDNAFKLCSTEQYCQSVYSIYKKIINHAKA